MIRNVIYDMGNVLIDYTPGKYAALFTQNEEDAQLLERTLFYGPEWALLDAGGIGLEEALESVCSRLPARMKDCCRETFYRWYEFIVSRDEMTGLVRMLKAAGYRQYLLSNAGIVFERYAHRLPALAYLDGCMVSAFERCVKPEPVIYQRLLGRFGLVADECLFIDDMPVNVRGAAACGFHAYCYEDQSFENLLAALAKMNICL